MNDRTASAHLKPAVRLLDLIMLGAGTAIGSAIFTVLGPAAKLAGSGILIATLLSGFPMALFAVIYAYMASAVPATAASYEWQRRFTHPAFAFAIVWLRVLSNALVMMVLARTLANYLSMVATFPTEPAILATFAVIFSLNYLGVAVAARVQTLLMSVLLVVLGIFVIAASPDLKPQLFVQALGGGWPPILAAMPLMIQLFLGIETASEVGEEVADAHRVVPLGIAGALVLTAGVYITVTFAALSLVGPQKLAASPAPLLDAAREVLGRFAAPLIVGAATVALVKSMNAIFLVYARFLFAMGRAGTLPAALGAIHPRFGTPHVATVVAFLASAACVFLPSNLLFLLLAVNIPTMMKYMGTCLAAYSVAARYPDVRARARLKLRPGLVKTLSILGAAVAITIAALGLRTDTRPYQLLGVWLALGLAHFAWRSRIAERRP